MEERGDVVGGEEGWLLRWDVKGRAPGFHTRAIVVLNICKQSL